MHRSYYPDLFNLLDIFTNKKTSTWLDIQTNELWELIDQIKQNRLGYENRLGKCSLFLNFLLLRNCAK